MYTQNIVTYRSLYDKLNIPKYYYSNDDYYY